MERFRAREAREAREPLSLQRVDKGRRAAGLKYLPLSFFFSPQSFRRLPSIGREISSAEDGGD